MTYKQAKQHRRGSLMILSLNAALLIGIGLILPLTSVKAAPAVTTISVQDPGGLVLRVKVAVFNEHNGQQIASGLTDPLTGRFTFVSPKGIELIVAAHTSTGYLGGARITPGDFATIMALHSLAAEERLCMPAPEADSNQKIQEAPVQTATSPADPARKTAVRSFYIDMPAVVAPSPCKIAAVTETGMPALDAAGKPQTSESYKATVAIVEWFTFAPIAQGQTNKQEHFSFDIPTDAESNQFLTVYWGRDAQIGLVPTLRSDTSTSAKLGKFLGVNY